MSTQINVTVDSGGLLERSRQQQVANRQAFVEIEQRADAEQTGTEQRQERLAAEGRNADGVLLLGRQPILNRYRQEPAANRRTKDYKLVYANFTSDFSSITPCTLAGCTTHTYRPPIPDPNSSLIEGLTVGGYTDIQYQPITVDDWPLSSNSIKNWLGCVSGIDPYYVGWGPHPIDTDYTWRQNVNKGRAELVGSLILPLSSSTYIVCQVSYGWSYWVRLYTTYTDQTLRSLIDCGGRVPNTCDLEIIVYYRRQESSQTWTHEEDHGSRSYSAQYISVLVGKQSQRVIDTPFAIQQALLEYATAANRQSLQFSSSNELVGNNIHTLESYDCEGGYYYNDPTTVTPVYRDTPQYNVVTGPAPSLTSLHFTYKGIANARTPAVYALLRSSVSNARSVTSDTYEAWYASSPYRYSGINSVDPSKLSLDPSEDGIPVWNWNAAGYCREQLLALGFSSSDLSL